MAFTGSLHAAAPLSALETSRFIIELLGCDPDANNLTIAVCIRGFCGGRNSNQPSWGRPIGVCRNTFGAGPTRNYIKFTSPSRSE
jgi:hypothetical protein